MDNRSQEQRPAKQRLIRLGEVRSRVGLGTTTIYRYLSRGQFPRPVSIGGGRVAWVESEIDAWIAERIEVAHDAVRSTIGASPWTLAAGVAARGGSAVMTWSVEQAGRVQENGSIHASDAQIHRPKRGKRS